MPSKRKKKPTFQGFDYTEVISYFEKKKLYKAPKLPKDGDHYDPWKNDELANKHFTDWLWAEYTKHWGKDDQEKQKALVQPCRDYLNAAIACCHFHSKPMWEGLAKIDHDETFLKYFTHLFDYLWT